MVITGIVTVQPMGRSCTKCPWPCLTLTTWLGFDKFDTWISLATTWQKERTNSCKLSSDLHVCSVPLYNTGKQVKMPQEQKPRP